MNASVKYAIAFVILSLASFVTTLAFWNVMGKFAFCFIYFAFSFLVMAAVYIMARPDLLCKSQSGRRSLFSWTLLAPYYLLNELAFQLYRRVSVEPAFVMVAPNVYFGRRLTVSECGGIDWNSVLDLAVEFPEVAPLRTLAGYRSLPVLDAVGPAESQLLLAVDWLIQTIPNGPVYIHCALGHGRSASVVIAYWLFTAEVSNTEEGETRLRMLRPEVELNPTQRRSLQSFEKHMHATTSV